MAKDITEKLNELDASSAVTPQEFQKVWGISKEEHLKRMMDYVHKRKAELVNNEKEELELMKKQLADLSETVEQLKKELNQLKAAHTEQPSRITKQYLETMKNILEMNNAKKGRRKGDDDNWVLMTESGGLVFKPFESHDIFGKFLSAPSYLQQHVDEDICDMLEEACEKKLSKSKK